MTLTPTANLGTGTISVELSAHDRTERSTTNTYTFSGGGTDLSGTGCSYKHIGSDFKQLTTWINKHVNSGDWRLFLYGWGRDQKRYTD